jgi:hypothetical protein
MPGPCKTLLPATVLSSMLGLAASAQQVKQGVPIVSRDVASQVSAFSYLEGPKSKLDLHGTQLTPTAKGEAEVEFEDGRSVVEAEVERLPDP